MKTPLESWSSHFLSILRIMSGLLFLEHGTSKILHIPPSTMAWSFHIASLQSWAGILELVGGILLVVGLFTRFTAFILSGEMAVAYFMVHAHGSFYPLENKGELAVLYCFVFLYLAAAGGGPFSLDRMLGRR